MEVVQLCSIVLECSAVVESGKGQTFIDVNTAFPLALVTLETGSTAVCPALNPAGNVDTNRSCSYYDVTHAIGVHCMVG